MNEYQSAAPLGQRGIDTKDHPLDPPAAPAISVPTTNQRKEPAEGVEPLELTLVFAVLGLLTLALVLFIALMVILQSRVI